RSAADLLLLQPSAGTKQEHLRVANGAVRRLSYHLESAARQRLRVAVPGARSRLLPIRDQVGKADPGVAPISRRAGWSGCRRTARLDRGTALLGRRAPGGDVGGIRRGLARCST